MRDKLLLIICTALLAGLIPAYESVFRPNQAPPMKHLAKIVIDKGDNLKRIAAKLDSLWLVDNAGRFVWACRLMLIEKAFPAGTFVVPYGLSNYELARRILVSGVNTANITIREGWTARTIASVLQSEIGIDSAEFLENVFDSSFAASLGLEAPSLEGYLFPDTYNLYLGMDARQAARKMVQHFHQMFDDKMQRRAWEMGFTVREIMTLASIVEGEIIFGSEAPLVSAVYHNRLRKGMRLQADPTIQYIIPDSPRRLRLSDLWIDSPYNTYRINGLPPGPINNPGLRALKAALHPADAPYLYFVAKGDGYHSFNVTLAEHNDDKRKYARARRMRFND